MFTFLVILTFLVVVALVVASSMQPARASLSAFELKRRASTGQNAATASLRREELLSDIHSLQRVVTSLLLVVAVILSIVTFGWVIGIIIAVIIAFEYGALARIEAIRRLSKRLFEYLEPHLLTFVTWASPVFALIRTTPLEDTDRFRRIDSREELQHLVSKSEGVLSAEEKRLITEGLAFSEKTVKSVMTPKGMIDSIKRGEFLGPLVLSELHDLGHSRLPVISTDIDHVVGILYTKDLLSLDNKRSVTAEKAMDSKVFYIHEEDSLSHALAAFLRTHHHLFIVVNDFRETVGLITLEDVIEALLGRKIIDEDDNHADIRTVATRNPRANNQPELHTDV